MNGDVSFSAIFYENKTDMKVYNFYWIFIGMSVVNQPIFILKPLSESVSHMFKGVDLDNSGFTISQIFLQIIKIIKYVKTTSNTKHVPTVSNTLQLPI